MKKMEEMMELFTEELAGFDNSVKKLELLSKHLESIKVTADNSATERLIKAHLTHEKSLVASSAKTGKDHGVRKALSRMVDQPFLDWPCSDLVYDWVFWIPRLYVPRIKKGCLPKGTRPYHRPFYGILRRRP